MKTILLPLAIGLTCACAVGLDAATINWGDPFVIDAAEDVSHPVGGTVRIAADFNTAAGTAAGDDDIINGITFSTVDQNIPDSLTTTISSGPSYNATYVGSVTDDLDLDALLDSHSYLPGNPGLASVTMEGLVPGTVYQLQLINVADDRACCAGRIYEPDNGAGSFDTGKQMQRGLHQSLIGTFTAGGTTQTVQLRSLNAATGNNDPGLSGLVLIELSPSSDTDGDGLFDAWETQYGLNPAVADSDNDTIPDSEEDLDMDGADNLREQEAGTDPEDTDTDDDELVDGVETDTGMWVSASDTGTDPIRPDSDGDGLSDFVENPDLPFVDATQTGSDPNLRDSDSDNFPDPTEVARGTDPGDADSTPGGITLSILGVGTLLGSDLTDPENDLDDSTAAGANFNWQSATASVKPFFGVTAPDIEGAFDIFDNKLGPASDKWCCDGPPQTVTLEFADPVSLTHLTISSANDTPARDPVDWQILGSNDGAAFTPIFTQTDPFGQAFWTERLQTIRIDLPAAAPRYRFIRYEVTRTGGSEHQLGEIEFFGSTGPGLFHITQVVYNPDNDEITLTWTSSPGSFYGVYYSADFSNFDADVSDSVAADPAAETTSFTFPNPLPGEPKVFFRVGEQP